MIDDGKAFRIASSAPLGEWEIGYGNWPVPFEDIAEIEAHFITTNDGTIWGYDGNWNGGLTWTIIPPLPEGAVGNQANGLNDIKSMFRLPEAIEMAKTVSPLNDLKARSK